MSSLSKTYSRIMSIGAVQRQSIISFTWQIVYTFVGFLSTMYFSHTVGASVLGTYFLFVAYYGIIGLVSEGGLAGGATKRISEGNDPDGYFSSFFFLRSFFVLLALIVLFFIHKYSAILTSELYYWLIIAIPVAFLYSVIQVGIAGKGKMGIHATSNFVNNMSRIFLQILAVFLGYNAGGLMGGFVGAMLIATLFESRFFDLRFVRVKWIYIKNLANFSFWLFLTSSGVVVYSYADTIMIGYFSDYVDVGVYKVVFQFTTFALIATTELRGVLWPKVSRWSKTSETELIEKSLSRAISYSLLFAVPIAMGGIVLGDKILYFFYGAEFATGYSTLVILLIVQIVNVFQFLFTTYLGALDMQKKAFWVTALSSVTNVFLNLLLIPLIGIFGAAIATLITMSLNALLARTKLSKVIQVHLEYKTILCILESSLLMALSVGLYRMFISVSNIYFLLIAIFSGVVLYGVATLVLNKNIVAEIKEVLSH
jgi:O-antigen/teichoic acid export membrane protein